MKSVLKPGPIFYEWDFAEEMTEYFCQDHKAICGGEES
jgi:hypothetical protein